jgi:hypothetical protein
VIKYGQSVLASKAENMKLALQSTSIPIPKVHKSFFVFGTGGYHDSTGYVVMDFIEGKCLADCWADLPLAQKEAVLVQVADMIRQMQSVKVAKQDPLGEGHAKGSGSLYTEQGLSLPQRPSDLGSTED